MSVKLFDTFQGVDGTALASHTPEIGGPWTSGATGWEIQGNKCVNGDAAAQSEVPYKGRIGQDVLTFDKFEGANGSFNINHNHTSGQYRIKAYIAAGNKAGIEIKVANVVVLSLEMDITQLDQGNVLILGQTPTTVWASLNGLVLGKVKKFINPAEPWSRLVLECVDIDNPEEISITKFYSVGLAP